MLLDLSNPIKQKFFRKPDANLKKDLDRSRMLKCFWDIMISHTSVSRELTEALAVNTLFLPSIRLVEKHVSVKAVVMPNLGKNAI